MRYEHIIKGTFISRPNRFIAHVQIKPEGKKEETVICHVKNTGRCKELLIPGVTCLLQFHPEAAKLGRKTEYSLISVWKKRVSDSLLINMDSQAPNQVAYEWLESIQEKSILPFHSKGGQNSSIISSIKREVTYGQSRFDLAFQINQTPAFMEVKGVTLEEDGLSMFPDAPTERGVKHIKELIAAHQAGYETYILFVIQMKKMKGFAPNRKTQPEFADILKDAKQAGVHILAYDCSVTEDTLSIDQPVQCSLDF